MRFEDRFNQVWLINLKRRPDRLTQFQKELERVGWPFRQPEVLPAVDGEKVGAPEFWRTGAGSYGCLRSHLAILEQALMNDVKSILVLEDDAVFSDSFTDDISRFLDRVPEDWQCLMLGGEFVDSGPVPVVPGVVKPVITREGTGSGIQRTHCYALRGQEVMKALYAVWANAAVHCDWVMGPCMAKFNTYAPDPFLVGQAGGYSDITIGRNPTLFWRPPTGFEPVIILHSPRDVMEELRNKGWHSGYSRDAVTGIDTGLRNLFAETADFPIARKHKLGKWIKMIQWEASAMEKPAVVTLWHPEVTVEMVRPLVQGKVIEITADTVEDALSQLPDDIIV